MKVGIVGKLPPIQGGVAVRTLQACRHFAARGHHVDIVTNANEVEAGFRQLLLPEDKEYLAGFAGGQVTVHQTGPFHSSFIPASPAHTNRLLGRALEVFGRARPDVIIGSYLQPYGVVAALVGRALGIPYVLRHAGSDIGRLSHDPDLAAAFRFAIDGAEGLLTYKRPRVIAALRAFGAENARLIDIKGSKPWGHDVAPAYDLAAYQAQVPAWLDSHVGLDGDLRAQLCTMATRPAGELAGPVIGCLGKVATTKGSFDLLDALAVLAKRGANFQFHTMSTGPAPVLERYWRAIVKCPELAARTRPLPPIAPWRVDGFLRQCDIGVFLERDFDVDFHAPGVPLEMLAAGTAFVVSKGAIAGGILEQALIPGRNAVLVNDPRDHDELVRALGELVDDPDRIRRLGQHGRLAFNTIDRAWGIDRPDPIVVAVEELMKGRAA